MITAARLLLVLAVATGAPCLGCSSDADEPSSQGPGEGTGVTGDAQHPPTGASAVTAWLAAGDYKAWACEPTAHDARSPSPHGKNRICSNDALSQHGAGEYPVGAAAVKELLDDSGANVVGYAVYRKMAPGAGESWYWFESTKSEVVADGLGTSGPPKDVCVGCHAGAGSDAKHAGHDLVYTQVK